MRNTIKAKTGYRVITPRKGFPLYDMATYHFDEVDADMVRVVADGDDVIMFALLVPYADYLAEKEGNECFNLCEVFTTRKGNQYIYWRDEEIDEDRITRVEV